MFQPASLLFFLLLALYASTAAHRVLLEDDGLFAMVAAVAGVGHPPGYPLYTLLVHLFTWLPIDSVVYRVHLASGVFGALAACAVFWCASFLVRERGFAFVAALGYGVSENFWSQSILADVYSLNAFLFFTTLGLSLAYLERPTPLRLRAIALFYGLCLANHWPLIALSTPCLLLVLWPRRSEIGRQAIGALPFGLVGLLPYAWLVWRSQTDVPVNFSGPIDSLRTFWYIVTREGYAGDETRVTSADWTDKRAFLGFMARQMLQTYTFLGALVAAVGVVWLRRRVSVSVWLGLIAGVLGTSFVLILILGFDYDPIGRATVRPFPLVAFGVLGLFFAAGLSALHQRVRSHLGPRGPWVVPLLCVAVILWSFAANLPANDRSSDTWAHDFATRVLEGLPEDSILFTSEDRNVGPIGYLHVVEGLRPDIEVYQDSSLVFANRLFSPITTPTSRQLEILESFSLASERPVFVLDETRWGAVLEDHGVYARVLSEGQSAVRLVPENLDYLGSLLGRTETDVWNASHRVDLLTRYGEWIARAAYLTADTSSSPALQAHLAAAEDSYASLLGMAGALARSDSPEHRGLAMRYLAAAEPLLREDLGKFWRAGFYYVRAHVAQRGGSALAAFPDLVRSVEIYSSSDNRAVRELLRFYSILGRANEFRTLRQRIFVDEPVPEDVRQWGRAMRRQLKSAGRGKAGESSPP